MHPTAFQSTSTGAGNWEVGQDVVIRIGTDSDGFGLMGSENAGPQRQLGSSPHRNPWGTGIIISRAHLVQSLFDLSSKRTPSAMMFVDG